MDLNMLRRLRLIYGNQSPTIPQVVLQYTLAEDFTTNATTVLGRITSSELQSFCESCLGVRGSFTVGAFKVIHFDIQSDVTPPADRSYITHFWFNSYHYFHATNQHYAITDSVVVPRNGTPNDLVSNSTLYTLRPELVASGNEWYSDIKVRASVAPFGIWKAGTYTMTLSYLGEVTY